MTSTIASVGVLDYGMGNLRSVAKSLEAVGARVVVSDSPSILNKNDLLVVPGVGAFASAMQVLKSKGLDSFIVDWVGENKPYFGICLGMQLLFESSEEGSGVKGLGLLRGRVKKFQLSEKYKVPHMGWNLAKPKKNSGVLSPSMDSADYFYFVHSFYPSPTDKSVVWTETSYGKTFCSGVAKGCLAATQFHPEKSGENGARFLKRLLKSLPEGGF